MRQVQAFFDHTTTITRADQEAIMFQLLAPLCAARPRRMVTGAHSNTEAALRSQIEILAISEGYGTSLRRQLYTQKHRIDTETTAYFTSVLLQLREGGWGKKAMAPQLQTMTTFRLHDGIIQDATQITAQATRFYTERFDRD